MGGANGDCPKGVPRNSQILNSHNHHSPTPSPPFTLHFMNHIQFLPTQIVNPFIQIQTAYLRRGRGAGNTDRLKDWRALAC
uniref:Uncharacterized protein n=1 Tax=Cucumis melo TaxID=3656 RepID=A0A9I9EHI1_CUCME